MSKVWLVWDTGENVRAFSTEQNALDFISNRYNEMIEMRLISEVSYPFEDYLDMVLDVKEIDKDVVRH